MEAQVIKQFRHQLRELKENILKENVYKSQDPNAINDIKSKMNNEYVNLRKMLRKVDVSSDLKRKMMYHLRRDFYIFPYTLDEDRIDEILKEGLLLPNDEEGEENKNRRFEVEYG
jgi:hypothetical protein